MKTYTLDYCVKTLMSRLDEGNNFRNYQKYLQFAIHGYRELNLHSAPTVKTVYLDMLPNKAVNLPTDYIKYIRIGIVRHGHIVNLGLDNELAINSNISPCGDPLPVVLNNYDQATASQLNGNGILVDGDEDLTLGFGYGWPFLDSFRNGQWVEGLFGVGGGFNGYGYFRVNPELNQIQFTSEVPSNQIALEYISDGINPDGSACVPTPAFEPLINWMFWNRLKFKKGSTQGEIEMARRDYSVSLNQLRHYNMSFNVSEYLESYRKNVYATPKR